ncbi:methyl-accepting chemotaxis protein [Pseudoalteromonas shioyasakiensis]|uniref:methyl-accepting chemotaxis protein n=1 Tax=Pseudoalteromonas shioyasakiensis TaxID=1190813 RepID=UPI002118E867|nr:methyl-accepting chemotaxis protein [Pseudoalteromonas shioyasakiensis]MCQ8877700.1 methyl-accepting chemotaxis protein [Pseudoalteromonas shioyasakiensis]
MGQFTVKKKLYVIFGIILSLTLVLGVFASLSLKSQAKQSDMMLDITFADADLYASRLAQADYMIQESESFKQQAIEYSSEALALLASVKKKMEVDTSIRQVDSIQADINEFIKLFKEFSQAKQALISSRTQFDTAALNVGTAIDETLASIEAYFKQNQQDFTEFSRFLKAKQFRDLFNETRVAVWKYSTTQDQQTNTQITNNIQKLKLLIDEMKGMMQSPATLQLLSQLQQELSEYQLIFNNTVAAFTQLNDMQTAMLQVAGNASNRMSALVSEEMVIADKQSEQAQTIMIVVLVFAFVIAALLSWWLIKSIMGPLALSVNFAQNIAKGDLTQRIEVSGSDEFSQLNSALTQSADSLRNVVEQLKQVTQELENSSETILHSVSGASNSVQNQQLETDMVATAINEMAAAAMQISHSASNASNTSQVAEQSVETSKGVVTKTESAMTELAQALGHASTVVNTLSENSANIEGILDVIRGIAEQTNLLALNAAIEAARAGEQGRGFAVVADEVRTLAQKTQESISEITNIIEAIQTGASDVVKVMATSNEKGDLVVELTAESSQSLSLIVSSINEIVDTNNQVAVGAEEQSSVAADVDNNVIKIKTLADDNAQSLHTISEQIDLLVKQTQSMTKLISFFKV